MNSTICDVRIIVNGRSITEFSHEGKTFMEGRGGSDFEISIKNKGSTRIMAVISVDGVSVINGGVASPDSPGYTINPFQTILIPGWKLNTTSAAKFTFGSRSNSYAQSSAGTQANCGVIGVIIWGEVIKPVYPWFGTSERRITDGGGLTSTMGHSSGLTGAMGHGSGLTGAMGGGLFTKLKSTTIASANASYSTGTVTNTVNNLGTEFGSETSFKTESVVFNKEAVIDTIVLYYDDARGLKLRGIVLDKPVQNRNTEVPDPFPATGCIPPIGWKG